MELHDFFVELCEFSSWNYMSFILELYGFSSWNDMSFLCGVDRLVN